MLRLLFLSAIKIQGSGQVSAWDLHHGNFCTRRKSSPSSHTKRTTTLGTLGTFVGPDAVHLLGGRLSSLQYVCFAPFCTCRGFLLECIWCFYLSRSPSIAVAKGSLGCSFFCWGDQLFLWPQLIPRSPLWTASPHLTWKGIAPFSPSPCPVDSQIDLAAWIAPPCLPRPEAKSGDDRSCSGSWSWRRSWRSWRDLGLRGLSLSCSFSPSVFPAAASPVQGRTRGCPVPCCLPLPRGMACCCQRAELRIFCSSGKRGRIWRGLPEPSCLPPLCCPYRPATAGQALRSHTAPQAAFSNVPFAKSREEAFLIIILGLFFFFFRTYINL